MKLSEINENLGIDYKKEPDLNPLQIAEDYYFGFSRTTGNYRDIAYQRCVDYNVDFTSTQNNIYNMVKKLIKVVCPKCGKDLSGEGGGGTYKAYTVRFTCSDCKTKVSLTVDPEDAITIEFNKK